MDQIAILKLNGFLPVTITLVEPGVPLKGIRTAVSVDKGMALLHATVAEARR